MRPGADKQRRLDALAEVPVNYDTTVLDVAHPPDGWTVDRRCQRLVAEPPGAPVPSGSFETACRLIRGYEFADPSLVRAFYDPDAPLQGRTMLLELRALGLVSVHVGVRVAEVYDDQRDVDGRTARVYGWAYRTLEGHVERGQMDWQIWKWLDTGDVEFRVHSVSQVARISNPVIWAGFHVLRRYERKQFLDSVGRRMRELTERAVGDRTPADAVRDASAATTARSMPKGDPAHEVLARELRDDQAAGVASAAMGQLMLTFDDGPDPIGTPAVLDALAAVGAHATFFLMAARAECHPELVARITGDGHTVGLHCDEHVRHTDRDEAWLVRDTRRALGRLDRLGIGPQLWRTPWGKRAPWTETLAGRFGLRLVGWDIDTEDWRGTPADTMLAATRDQLTDGSIVLAHDGIGPGATRTDCAQTAAFVTLVASDPAAHGLDLVSL